jgi:hypothetical protein
MIEADKGLKFRIAPVDWIVIGLLLFKLALVAIFFPELEMPDEDYHYGAIIGNNHGSLYYLVMHKVYVFLRMLNLPDCFRLSLNHHFAFA